MHEKTPQDYANELLRIYKENASSLKEDISSDENADIHTPPRDTEPIFEDGTGGLVVSVTTLRRLYPVNGAVVTVFTGDSDAPTVIETDTTDESGKSRVFKLKTPPKADSQQAESGETPPYSAYGVSVKSDGYVEQIAVNIPIFSGVVSVQNIDLIPVSAAGKHTQPQIIQEGNSYDL